MITKFGRKPYDPEEPRMPIGEDLREPPIEYRSIQQAINTGPGGTADPDRLSRYLEQIMQKGFNEIPLNDIYTVPKGSRVAYITSDFKWRSGGFLVDVKNSNKLYNVDAKLDEYKVYFAYRAFNRALFHVQEDDVLRIFVKIPRAKQKAKKDVKELIDKIVLPRPTNKTRFPVTALDRKGSIVIIKYFKDDHARRRFLEGRKYNDILTHGFVFEDEDDTEKKSPKKSTKGPKVKLLGKDTDEEFEQDLNEFENYSNASLDYTDDSVLDDIDEEIDNDFESDLDSDFDVE